MKLKKLFSSVWLFINNILYLSAICWFTVVVLVLGWFALVQLSQVSSLLHRLEDYSNVGLRILTLFFLVTAITLWAFLSWYSARLKILFAQEEALVEQKVSLFLIRYFPRFLGVIPFGILIETSILEKLYWLSGLVFLLGGIFYYVISTSNAYKDSVNLSLEKEVDSFWDLKKLTTPRHILITQRIQNLSLRLLSIYLVISCVFTFVSPFYFMTFIPSVTIVIFAFGCWNFANAFVALFIPKRFRVFAFFTVIASFFISNQFFDNHTIRKLDSTSSQEFIKLKDQEPSLIQYQQSFAKRFSTPNSSKTPLFIVLAEGGASRSAFWVSQVLSTIQHQNPSFSKHIFAYSSVSGGTLGIATFNSLLTEPSLYHKDKTPYARAFLSQDFISPTMTKLLYSEIFARAIPFGLGIIPTSITDRAQMLEKTWERAWTKVLPESQNPFTQSVHSFFVNRQTAQNLTPPTHIINGTIVQTGERGIFPPLKSKDCTFSSIYNLRDSLLYDIRLSTAVLLSARFPVISPSGVLQNPDSTVANVVDGGYYDNSGATAAKNLLYFLQKDDAFLEKFKIYVLDIRNRVPTDRCISTPVKKTPQGILEAIVPAVAIYNSGLKGHTEEARGQLKQLIHKLQGEYIAIPLYRDVSLSWFLSKNDVRKMVQRMESDTIRQQLKRIGELLP